MGLDFGQLLANRHKFVFFDIMSCRCRLCWIITVSVGRGFQRISKGCGFEYHVRLTLCLKTKKLSNDYHICPLIPNHVQWLTSKKRWATNKRRMLKLIYNCVKVKVDKRFKVSWGGARTCLAGNIQTQVCVLPCHF